MTVIIDGKYHSIRIINANYSETQSEVMIISGNGKGTYCIVNKMQIRKKPTIRFEWSKLTRDYYGQVNKDHDKWIYLEAYVTVQTEDEGINILDKIETYLNHEIGNVKLLGYPYWDEEKEYYDCFFFERDHGNVAKQKREIMQAVKKAKKTLIQSD